MAALAPTMQFSATALTRQEFAADWQYAVASTAALTPPRRRTFTYSARSSSYVISFEGEILPGWVRPTISSFIAIQSLPDNWDSYGGKTVSNEFVEESLAKLGEIMEFDSPAPSVVPLGDGGIQIEWHRNKCDFEMVFSPTDGLNFFFRNRALGSILEGNLDDIGQLKQLLRDLA